MYKQIMPESLGKQVSFSLNFDRPQDFFDPGVVDFSQFSTNVSSSEIKARIEFRKNLSNVEFGGGGISWLLQYIMSGISSDRWQEQNTSEQSENFSRYSAEKFVRKQFSRKCHLVCVY